MLILGRGISKFNTYDIIPHPMSDAESSKLFKNFPFSERGYLVGNEVFGHFYNFGEMLNFIVCKVGKNGELCEEDRERLKQMRNTLAEGSFQAHSGLGPKRSKQLIQKVDSILCVEEETQRLLNGFNVKKDTK